MSEQEQTDRYERLVALLETEDGRTLFQVEMGRFITIQMGKAFAFGVVLSSAIWGAFVILAFVL